MMMEQQEQDNMLLLKWIKEERIPNNVFDIFNRSGINTLLVLSKCDVNILLRDLDSILNPLQKKRFCKSFNELQSKSSESQGKSSDS